MTDEQIIKALECCGSYRCNECAYFNDDFCIDNMTKLAIDLINRQKVEIERLKSEQMMADGYAEALEERAKTEAIKEFAERFKKKAKVEIYCDNTLPKPRETYCIEEDGIDNLVKEMMEGEE